MAKWKYQHSCPSDIFTMGNDRSRDNINSWKDFGSSLTEKHYYNLRMWVLESAKSSINCKALEWNVHIKQSRTAFILGDHIR